MFLRDQKKAKFIQTFGRVARLDRNDRRLIEDKVITPNDLEQMNKPYAWIIIPAVMREDDDKLANLESLIDELRDFEFNPAEGIEPRDRGRSNKGDDDNEIVPEDNSIRKAIAQVIENYNHKVEQERIANMTWEEKIQKQKSQGKNGSLDFDF